MYAGEKGSLSEVERGSMCACTCAGAWSLSRRWPLLRHRLRAYVSSVDEPRAAGQVGVAVSIAPTEKTPCIEWVNNLTILESSHALRARRQANIVPEHQVKPQQESWLIPGKSSTPCRNIILQAM